MCCVFFLFSIPGRNHTKTRFPHNLFKILCVGLKYYSTRIDVDMSCVLNDHISGRPTLFTKRTPSFVTSTIPKKIDHHSGSIPWACMRIPKLFVRASPVKFHVWVSTCCVQDTVLICHTHVHFLDTSHLSRSAHWHTMHRTRGTDHFLCDRDHTDEV